jgi:hypothetical protein
MNVLNRHAIVRGALIGLMLFVPLTAARVLIDRSVNDFDHSGWAPTFALALFCVYFVAAFVAGRLAPEAPLSNAMLGAIGALVLWIPIRIVIWAIRDNGQALVSGTEPALGIGQVLVQVVIAAFLGLGAGWIVARRNNRTAASLAVESTDGDGSPAPADPADG